MENMERFAPLYAIAYAILIGTANLRFGKEDYFYVLVFFGLFYKRNRKVIAWLFHNHGGLVNSD